MKKIPIILGVIFLTLGKSYGQDTIFAYAWTPSSNRFFDLNERDTVNKYIYIDTTQTNNIWELGIPSKTIFNSAYSAPLALVTDTINTYPDNNTSSFSFIVWTNCNVSEINFWHKINTDLLKDGGIVEYSIDGGSTWNNIINSGYTFWNFYSSTDSIASNSNKSGFTGTYGWINSSFYGPTLNDVVEYKFTFTSDSTNTNKDGWMLDNISINNGVVAINEIIQKNFVHVFPNPTSDFISIQTDNKTQFVSVDIKDILGRKVLTTKQTSIDLSKFETGIYFMEITTTEGKVVKHIVRK